MIGRICSVIIISIAAIALTGAMKEKTVQYWNEGDHSKVIKFNHKFHIQDSGVECAVCHHAASTSTRSADNLMGDHESCTSCHEGEITDKCGYCHVDPENIVSIENPERELIFSHENHVGNNIECTQCHSGLENVEYASQENMPEMELCVSCHKEETVADECGTCHTDFVSLLPGDHLRGSFRKDHKRLTRLGSYEITCATCHSESFCQDCHTGIELGDFGVYHDLMGDPLTRVPHKDSPRQLKLQHRHSLNYKFTHGIDARSRETDCIVCHDRQSFCVECHQSGTIQEGKIKPRNHKLAGFITIGRGSGGGRHAEMAKRDIENCASCHDVQGADPTCMLCHDDDGGVRR
jgi:hypothetical protein